MIDWFLIYDFWINEEFEESDPLWEYVVVLQEFREIDIDAHVERAQNGFEEVCAGGTVDSHELADECLELWEDELNDVFEGFTFFHFELQVVEDLLQREAAAIDLTLIFGRAHLCDRLFNEIRPLGGEIECADV